MRINRFLAQALSVSRRQADDIIKTGDVIINGNRAAIGSIVDESDSVIYRKKNLNFDQKHKYFVLYKPKGIITSLSSKQGKSIADFLPKGQKLFPIGRLDKDSEGLLIITNDGHLAQKLTHPKYQKEKVYILEFTGKPSNLGKSGIILQFTKGIIHNRIKYSVDSAKFIASNKIELVMHEGKSRQIRIIAGKIGLEINSLVRVGIGKLNLKDFNIKPGQIIKIKQEQII